jgi:hypothetical protein
MVAGPGKGALTASAALLILLIAAGDALSQAASPSLGLQEQPQLAPQPAEPASAAPLPPAPVPENSGLINEMGKLFDKLPSILPPLKSPSEAIDDLNARTKSAVKDAGDTVSRLARPSSMVSGRMICPAANGTPDCKAGADRLCQSKGFKAGSSLGTDAVQSCSPKAFIPGRQRKPDDCRTDNFVTAALCQ